MGSIPLSIRHDYLLHLSRNQAPRFRLGKTFGPFQEVSQPGFGRTHYHDNVLSLARALETPNRNVNEPFRVQKHINHNTISLWRTPLEWAVDEGASADIVAYLLEKGAQPSLATLKLAIAGAVEDWNPKRTRSEFANAEKIIEVLSAHGVDWSQVQTPLDNRSRNEHTVTDLVAKVGAQRALALGVDPALAPSHSAPIPSADEFIAARRPSP